MAKPIHMFELPVEIEPFRPGVERGTSLMSHIVVSAAVVAFCTRVTIAPAKLLEDLSGPPVEMGIDDPHDLTESITQRCSTVAAVYFGDAPRILKFKNSGCVPEIDRRYSLPRIIAGFAPNRTCIRWRAPSGRRS